MIAAPGFFREQLAEDILPGLAARGFASSCPLIELEGTASSDNGARAGGVRVYGVDARFWQFHGRRSTPAGKSRGHWLVKVCRVNSTFGPAIPF